MAEYFNETRGMVSNDILEYGRPGEVRNNYTPTLSATSTWTTGTMSWVHYMKHQRAIENVFAIRV